MVSPLFPALSSCRRADTSAVAFLCKIGSIFCQNIAVSAITFSTRLRPLDGLCDKQALKEPVWPVMPSLCHSPRNHLVGRKISGTSPCARLLSVFHLYVAWR